MMIHLTSISKGSLIVKLSLVLLMLSFYVLQRGPSKCVQDEFKISTYKSLGPFKYVVLQLVSSKL